MLGIAVTAKRRPAVAIGLLAGAACVWAFVLNYDVADPEVFLIPVFVVMWMFAGAAAAALIELAGRAGSQAAIEQHDRVKTAHRHGGWRHELQHYDHCDGEAVL